MPVVQLSLDRLQKQIGKPSNKNTIVSKIPFLGLDIEEQTDEYIRVEYSPNRPDYATDFGIALGLQGLLGIKKGIPKLSIKKANYSLKVNPSVQKVRPFVTSIVARNGNLNDDTLKGLITLQEDLHFGIGRRRKKASIGIHDLDKITFPITYTTVSREHKFAPLGSSQENTIGEILEKTDVGQEYGFTLSNALSFPIIFDAKGNTISFPPIINSNLTTVSTNTKNLLVEVTAIDKKTAEDMLAVIATTLQAAGFSLHSVKISGGKNSTPKLNLRKMILDTSIVNNTLGLNLNSTKIVGYLRKCRLDATAKKNKIICNIPRYRFDIIGPMDLVEEVALGYGIENLKPSLPLSASLGQKNSITTKLDSLRLIMIGLGYTEALNSSLVSRQVHNVLTNRNNEDTIEVLESKSQEHTILRDSLIPELLENLAKNVHEQYPQKLFELGTIFSKGNPITESNSLAAISAHKDANFSEIKSILQSCLKIGFNIETKTSTSSHPFFSEGRTANILVNDKTMGVLGEIDSKIIENFKIRVPIVCFEIQLSGLIFD